MTWATAPPSGPLRAMPASVAPHTPGLRLSLVPLLALLAIALLTNAGLEPARTAHAATDSVVVSSTVTATASTVTNGCASDTMSISVGMSALSTGTCVITFGSTNASGITLSADDSTPADQFMNEGAGNFADASAGCAAMATTDQVGYKVDTGGSATVNLCTADTAGTNAQFSPIPNDVPSATTPETVCSTNASGDQTCPVVVGMFEAGGDAPAGTYSGTITLTSS